MDNRRIDEELPVAAKSCKPDYSNNDYMPPRKRQSRDSAKSSNFSGLSAATRNKVTAETKFYRGRNVGKLSKMLQIPVDIFCEIAVYLEPLGLLQLARTSKSFNRILMSRGSKPIWRMARSYYSDLPDCPPDLSEPAYAKLLFEKECHTCLAPRTLKVDYTFRVRLCHRCRPSSIVGRAKLFELIPGLTEELLECIPCRRPRFHRNHQSFYVAQVKALITKYYSTIPQGIPAEETRLLQEEFYDTNKQLVVDIVHHAENVERWVETAIRSKQAEGVHAARRREISLRAKLVELGHREDDFPRMWEDWEWNNIMNRRKDLTHRTWNKVQPKLEACIQRVKRVRAERERSLCRQARKQEILGFFHDMISEREKHRQEYIISDDDAILLPSVAALLMENDYKEKITREKWDAALGQIEKDMDTLMDYPRQFLVSLIRSSVTDSPGQNIFSQVPEPSSPTTPSASNATNGDCDAVSLHLAYFKCQVCLESDPLLKYPALLSHSHPVENMTFEEMSTRYASHLLTIFAGQHREEDLCTLGPQLQCLRCDETTRPMDWSQLIRHFRLEQEWYDGELLRLPHEFLSAEVILHNDHSLDDLLPAFSVLDIDTAYILSDNWARSMRDEFPNRACALCKWSHRQARTSKEVQSHIRRNHLKTFAPGDMTYQWGSSTSHC